MADCFKTIALQPDWGQLRVELEFSGNEINFSVYQLILWEAHANTRVLDCSGNNHNDSDDNFYLPSPNEKNKGRSLDCKTFITFLSDDNPGENRPKKHFAFMKLYQANSTEPVCTASEEYTHGDNAHSEGNLIIKMI
jgi:hypothetical protein